MSSYPFACDLETTGVTAGSCILSIALVPFHTEYPLDHFYEKISHKLSRDDGFTDNDETLNWWDKQKPEVQEEAFSGIRSPEAVLLSLNAYLKAVGDPKEIYIWGNGKDFDNVILTAAFTKLGLKPYWDFRNNKCYRDLAAHYPYYTKVKPDIPHHAYYDALAEAKHAEIIFQGILSGLPPIIPGVNDGTL